MNTHSGSMNAATTVTPRSRRLPLATFGKLTVAALALQGLIYVVIAVATGPRPIILAHIAVPLIVAGIVASGLQWTPALGALLGCLLFVDEAVILSAKLTHPDDAITFALAAMLFASALLAAVTGIGATVQNYRRPPSDRSAPPWIRTGLIALAALVIGGTGATAIQPRSLSTGISPEVLSTLPTVGLTHFTFDHTELHAKVGELVALQLVNADTTAHYLDIDELNVHTLVPAGKTNVAIFRPSTPGTYTYYCHIHANKAGGTGMIGHLIITP